MTEPLTWINFSSSHNQGHHHPDKKVRRSSVNRNTPGVLDEAVRAKQLFEDCYKTLGQEPHEVWFRSLWERAKPVKSEKLPHQDLPLLTPRRQEWEVAANRGKTKNKQTDFPAKTRFPPPGPGSQRPRGAPCRSRPPRPVPAISQSCSRTRVLLSQLMTLSAKSTPMVAR